MSGSIGLSDSEELLDVLPVGGEVGPAEVADVDPLGPLGADQHRRSAWPRRNGSPRRSGPPSGSRLGVATKEFDNRCAAPDLDVVGVRADEENA